MRMSMNLVLKRGESLNFTPFQTPTYISHKAMESGDTTTYYKQWVLLGRAGNFPIETEEHFAEIDRLLSKGYYWIIT